MLKLSVHALRIDDGIEKKGQISIKQQFVFIFMLFDVVWHCCRWAFFVLVLMFLLLFVHVVVIVINAIQHRSREIIR